MLAQSFCNRTVILITGISLYQAKSLHLKCPVTEENAPSRRLTKAIVRGRGVKWTKSFFYAPHHSKGMFPSLVFQSQCSDQGIELWQGKNPTALFQLVLTDQWRWGQLGLISVFSQFGTISLVMFSRNFCDHRLTNSAVYHLLRDEFMKNLHNPESRTSM